VRLGKAVIPSTYARGRVMTLGRSRLHGQVLERLPEGRGSPGRRSNDRIKVAKLVHPGERLDARIRPDLGEGMIINPRHDRLPSTVNSTMQAW
jgi:hypothetical protein